MNIGIVANLLRENSINNNKTLGNSLEKLSTGLKINKASDDASALAISDKLRTQASGIKQGIDNANSAIAMMNIADKSMDELSNILDTIKAKAIQMNTDTTNEDGRKIIKTDILKLIESYDDIVCRTNYNQTPLLNGCASPFDFQVGDDSNEIISVNVDSVESRQMGEADPYKLKNFITGFSMTVAIPEISNTEESNYIFETIGTSGSISTYEITESPVEIPLYIEDRANVKIGIYSNASDSIVTSSMRSLVDYYTEEGFSTENYGSSKLDNYSLDIDLLFIVLPTEEFDNDEVNMMTSFLDSGGRIFFTGEHSGYSTNVNNIISNTISLLGGEMSILNGEYDGENNVHTNTDGNMNLNNIPLLAGVSTFTTDLYAQLEVSGSLTQPIIVDDDNRIVMAEQGAGKGRISLVADVNWFTTNNGEDTGLDSTISQNDIFLNNLAISSYTNTQFVNSGGNPNTESVIYTFSDEEPYSSLNSTNITQNENLSCDCDDVELIRNDIDPVLKIQAQNLMRVIDEALSQLNAQRANVGAGTNQLESSARNQVTNYVNIKNAESIIRDVSYEEESSNFNKANIIAQAGSYVQSQANEIDKQSVAHLLK